MFDHDIRNLVVAELERIERLARHQSHEVVPEHIMAALSDVKSTLSTLHDKVEMLVSKIQPPAADTSEADNDEIVSELAAIGSLIDEAVSKLAPATTAGGKPVVPVASVV